MATGLSRRGLPEGAGMEHASARDERRARDFRAGEAQVIWAAG
jgi:hypothetical protein